MTPFVVAVSGVSGAGKTTLIDRTVELLGDAVALHFDDYAEVSSFPPDLRLWLDEGADVDEWKTPHFSADVARLRAGQPIELPHRNQRVYPARWVLIEEPFAKLRSEMSGLIDLAVFVDLPPDLLFARRLLRRMREEREQFGDALLERLERDLEHHVNDGHHLDRRAMAMLRNSADLLLDGTRHPATLAEELASRLQPPKRR